MSLTEACLVSLRGRGVNAHEALSVKKGIYRFDRSGKEYYWNISCPKRLVLLKAT